MTQPISPLRSVAPSTRSNGLDDSVLGAVGTTPIVRLKYLPDDDGAEVWVKLEFLNPLASVKDRIGLAMILDGEKQGHVGPDTHVIEPTSGNTGLALAFLCAARQYRLTLTMPESMSLERRALLRHLGAELILTPAKLGMKAAIDRATELAQKDPTSFMPQQFENPANPAIHESSTGPEIWEALDGRVDAVVAGVGTGGTITGVTRFARQHNPDFKAIAVEPADSPVISGGQPGLHMIQGIGGGFIPGNLDTSLLDDIVLVSNDDAFNWSRRLAQREGILGGISTGANVFAALDVAKRPEFRGKRIVTFACSSAERYLSTALFEHR